MPHFANYPDSITPSELTEMNQLIADGTLVPQTPVTHLPPEWTEAEIKQLKRALTEVFNWKE